MTYITQRGMLRTPPRELVRIQWQQRWEHILRERGLTNSYDYFMPTVQHKSHLIRFFTGRHGIEKAQDIFLATHIFNRPNAQGLKIPRAVSEMQGILKRMQEDAAPETNE